MPSYSDLKKQFDYVSILFRNNAAWKTLASLDPQEPLASIDRMELIQFDRKIELEEAIKEMAEKGYRPATHLELIAWAEKNPEEQRKHWIVALGSSTMCGDRRYVALLSSDSDRRILDGTWFGREWGSDRWFLFVLRKESSSPLTLERSTFENGALSLGLLIKATEAFLEVLKNESKN